MNPFNIAYMPQAVDLPERPIQAPCIIEGADVYDTLCPVSKATGHRENPLSLLQKVLPPDKTRLAAQVLTEIPSIRQENPNISDQDAIDMCVSRFATGSKFEDNQVREALLRATDVLFPDLDSMQKQQVVEAAQPDAASAVGIGDGDS